MRWFKIFVDWFKSEPDSNFDNTTRVVKSKSGKKVEVYNDWPDGMADVISDCFKTGKSFSGKIKNGKVTVDNED